MGQISRVFDSSLDSVDQAEQLALEIAEKAGFEEDDRHRIGMAVRECMVNAVAHGNRYSAHKKVTFDVDMSGGQYRVTIRDQGPGFDLSDLPDPLADENLLRHSGRGIFLMKAFMDEFMIRRLDPSGTEVVLVKNLSGSPDLNQGQS
jgi:serine/threonine-protein kinase RsbW